MASAALPVPNVTARLTILLITYNHARYIERAIDGIFDQELDEPIVVILADDASADGTRDQVIRRFADRPEFTLKILSYDKNLGPTRNYQRSFAACETEFVEEVAVLLPG